MRETSVPLGLSWKATRVVLTTAVLNTSPKWGG